MPSRAPTSSSSWTINEGYRNIPLADFYPGDSSVDIVGISLFLRPERDPVARRWASPSRWQTLTGEPMGLNEVYAFATQHREPLGVPGMGRGVAADPG